MANPEHLAILKQGVEAWNRWRRENPTVVPYLHGAELRGARLSGANLSGADLRMVRLEAANLHQALLVEANLSGFMDYISVLWGADLSDADLSMANLSEANLSEATLSGEWRLHRSQLDGSQ